MIHLKKYISIFLSIAILQLATFEDVKGCDNLLLKTESFALDALLKEKGIDVSKVSFRMEKLPPHTVFLPQKNKLVEANIPHNFGLYIELLYFGKVIGDMTLRKVDLEVEFKKTFDFSAFKIEAVEIHKDFQGKGLGSVFYLFTASYLATHINQPLVGHSRHTDQAGSVWNRFVEHGVAYEGPKDRVGNFYYVTVPRHVQVYGSEVVHRFKEVQTHPDKISLSEEYVNYNKISLPKEADLKD